MTKPALEAPDEANGVIERTFAQCRSRQGMVQALREALDMNLLPPGTRLPSIRSLQDITGMRYHEVYRALEVLAAEGRIDRRRGSGTYVSEQHDGFRRTKTNELRIGILPPLWDPDFSRYAVASYFGGISAQADLRHRVQILPSRIAESSPTEFLARVRYLHLDGLIWIKPPITPPVSMLRLHDAGVPTVLIGRSYQHLPVTCVDYDHAAMGETVADWMVGHGRRKLVVMSGVRNDQQTENQVGALRAAMEKRGLSLPDDQIVTVRIESVAQVYTLDLRESVIHFLKQHPDYDAVFSMHPDQLGALEYLHETGFRRCPEDFYHLHYGYYYLHRGRPCPAFPSAFLSVVSMELGRQAVIELEKLVGLETHGVAMDFAPHIAYDPYA